MVWRLIIPLPLHVEEVTPLQWDGTDAANLVCTDGAGQRNLARHRGTADDRVLQSELFDHRSNATNIGIFVIGVTAWVVTFVLMQRISL